MIYEIQFGKFCSKNKSNLCLEWFFELITKLLRREHLRSLDVQIGHVSETNSGFENLRSCYVGLDSSFKDSSINNKLNALTSPTKAYSIKEI